MSRGGVWKWIAIGMGVLVLAILIAANVMVRRAGPVLKARVIETLSERLRGRVELDRLDVSVVRGLEVTGGGLRVFGTAAKEPLIALNDFSFRAGLTGLFFKPTHVGTVYVTAMTISIPPRELREQYPRGPSGGKVEMLVDRIVCRDSRLIINTLKPGKDPKDFELREIELTQVGPGNPWKYTATLTNAIPRGDIHANGTFGPWNADSPGDAPVTGHYTFEHADLNTIKGIGGILSSTGDFEGNLNKIAVRGTTDTPDFSLDTADHKVPLQTSFEAIVDGTSGDTYLQAVDAKLRQTAFKCSGTVINEKGVGHAIDLDLVVSDGRLQDFLDLAVKTRPPLMTARLSMKAKLHIHPGKESVARRIGLNGDFGLRSIHFANPDVQDRVDMLSLRARGEPDLAKPGAEDVRSQMRGSFTMDAARLQFKSLDYALPGAKIQLAGVYSLDGDEFDFEGKVRTEAKLSQMVGTWWKSWLLKPVDPFFKKHGANAEIPVKITGTKSAPKFGLDLKRKKE